jgi:hypothetical protein
MIREITAALLGFVVGAFFVLTTQAFRTLRKLNKAIDRDSNHDIQTINRYTNPESK